MKTDFPELEIPDIEVTLGKNADDEDETTVSVPALSIPNANMSAQLTDMLRAQVIAQFGRRRLKRAAGPELNELIRQHVHEQLRALRRNDDLIKKDDVWILRRRLRRAYILNRDRTDLEAD